MNIMLILVTSVNGRLTKGSSTDVSLWSSPEDQQYFGSCIKKASLIIMGSNTYNAAKERIQLEKGKLRIVMTSKPEQYRYDAKEGQLEFTSESAQELIKRLETKGEKQILLVGGSDVAVQFFRAQLITMVSLTLEPYVFGEGVIFANTENLNIHLRLKKMKQLNKKGTLLLQYAVVYDSRES